MTQHDAARVERGPITEVKRFALGMADLLERQGFTIAAAELRRLHAELERCKQVCAATSESWRTDAEKWKAQRDALLKALQEAFNAFAFDDEGPVWADSTIAKARAAIKAAEENT